MSNHINNINPMDNETVKYIESLQNTNSALMNMLCRVITALDENNSGILKITKKLIEKEEKRIAREEELENQDRQFRNETIGLLKQSGLFEMVIQNFPKFFN